MNGIHLIAELYECAAVPSLIRAEALNTLCQSICVEHGLEIVGSCFHQFGTAAQPAGATGAVVLAESHLAIHTWPELGSVTLDLYVCNFSRNNEARAHTAFADLIAHFAPGRLEQREITRGALSMAQTTA